MRNPSIGSISEGTLLTADLLATFADELESIIKAHDADMTARNQKAPLAGNALMTAHTMFVDASRLIDEARTRLIDEARTWIDTNDEGDYDDMPDDHEENGSELVNELIDALNEYAPPYCYFGANEGDGACFGFWPNDIDDVKEAIEGNDGLIVDDTSDVPGDFVGDVLHVNDHGNVTLYVADKGALSEVWACV